MYGGPPDGEHNIPGGNPERSKIQIDMLNFSNPAVLADIGENSLSFCPRNVMLSISPEMAIRLSIVFNTSEELWINLQAGYDLWKARKVRSSLRLRSFISRIAVTA